MANRDEGLARANAEANEVFGKLQRAVTQAVKEGVQELDVLDISRRSGLELDEGTLEELQIPPIIPVLSFVPWHHWFCWRPLWCWWWHRYYPWYRCCPYWWHRCHWYPH